MNKKVKELVKRKGPLAENEVKDLMKTYGIRTTKYKVSKQKKVILKILVLNFLLHSRFAQVKSFIKQM